MSIDKWKELNKDWLCKMFHKEETAITWETWLYVRLRICIP